MQRLQPNQKAFARALRADPTDAEQRLWRHLRAHQLDGVCFRRQHPLGPYVVDLVCLEARLILEVDGGQHAGSEHDAKRDAWLQGQGFRVMRFWNHELLGNNEGVLEAVRAALVAPPPQPSPWQGEGA